MAPMTVCNRAHIERPLGNRLGVGVRGADPSWRHKVSDTDSFIDEVSEEVRRDRLFKLMKKYGWIAIALVLLLVGGAAFNEWRKSQAQARAEALGDAVMAAFQDADATKRAAALADISGEGAQGAVVALLAAGEDLRADQRDAAIAALEKIAAETTLEDTYRQLAELKLILLQGDTVPAAERLARLKPLAVPGAPYRLLAEEQMAIAEISSGDTAGALTRLQGILDDTEVTAGLRRRASQLIVALGGELNPA
jgi:hypothetical protein